MSAMLPPSRIAFHVRKTSTQTNAPSTITFEDVAYELGGAWNREVHHFVSPYTGVFVFSFTMFNYGQSTVGAITNPPNVIQATYGYGGNQLGTAVAVLYAVTNDIIRCELLEGQVYGHQRGYTHFTGFMLHQV